MQRLSRMCNHHLRRLEARQRHAGLAHVFARAVGVGDFAGLVALEEQELAGTFVGVDLCGQRGGVGEFQRDVAFPLRLQRGDVDDDTSARVGRLAHAHDQHVAGDAEVFHRPGEGKGVRRDGADIRLPLDEARVTEFLGVDHG